MLQLVLGKSGYGKTTFVFDSIKKLVDEGERVLLITPEQFSFIAERRLLEELGEQKISLVENMSFTRLNNEVNRIYGGEALPVLSSGAKAVMMQKAALMVQDSLVLYGKNIKQASFINSMVKIYDEMKSCRVTADDILVASDKAEKQILHDKLFDISTIIQSYDALIEGKYVDCATELTRLYKKLLSVDYFKDKTVFVDGFSGFVAQEYKILEVVIKQAKKVYVTFCSDTYLSVDKYNLYYYVQKNINILKDITRQANEKILNPIILNTNHRSLNNELAIIESNIYSNKRFTFDDEVKGVSIYSAKNVCDECDRASSQIVDLLRNGYRASEIAVICRDLGTYEKELMFSFEKYNVPYFKDERQGITSQPIIMFVNFLLRSVINSYQSDDIISMLKTGLTGLDNNAISDLENYIFLWNISGSKWKKEFVSSTRGFVEKITDSDQSKLNGINVSRDYIITKIEKFKRSVNNSSCADICRAIYYALIDFGCDKGLKSLAIELDNNGKSALAIEQDRVWDLLMDILDRLASVGGEEIISIKDFSKLFGLMIANEDLGSIPSGLDNIQIGSADRMRCNNPRAVFVLGANEGSFPQAVTSSGLLSETDRVSIMNNNADFKLYSYGEILNAQEKFFAYMALTSAREKLFVSYVIDKPASSIVTELSSIFPRLTVDSANDKLNLDSIQSIDNAFEVLASNYGKNDTFVASLDKYFSTVDVYASRLNAVKSLTDNNDIQINDNKISTELFGKDMYLSASKIEDYFNCAFRYFCKFGVGAVPRQKAQLDPMQTGTVIHYVLEQIIKEYGSNQLTLMEDAEIKLLVNKYLNEYLTSKMGESEEFTPRFKYQFMRLSRMLIRVVLRLKDEFSQSDFEAKAFELKIGNGSGDEPIKSKAIPLEDGGSVSIKGSIDRVDVFDENGKRYVRVVDYKSGTKKFALSDILYGLNLQMFIYLFALCQSNHELSGISSGVLYLHAARKIYSLDNNGDSSKLEKSENEEFKMQGIVLNDDENEIAQHMEKDLSGKYIPVKATKKGISGDFASLEELGRISRKIDSLIAEMGTNLHNGKINQNPVLNKNHKHTCDYCDYKFVCMNRAEINNRQVDDLSNSEVMNKLKEDEANA